MYWFYPAFSVLLAFSPGDPPAAAASLKAGFADRDITPDIGMEMPGNYGKVYGRSVHDPCKVRAAVFDDGEKRVALVGVDALMVRRETVLAAREAIRERCGIPPGQVMVGASHSHSSGPTGMILPGEFDHASPLVQRLAYRDSSTADPGYLKRVEQAIVDAVCLANEFRIEARLSFGSGREDRVSFNRRVRMKSGVTFTHPGRGNPNSAGYAGPIDPEVGVIGAWASSSTSPAMPPPALPASRPTGSTTSKEPSAEAWALACRWCSCRAPAATSPRSTI